MKTNQELILDKIEAWYTYCQNTGHELKRILLHPNDMPYAPEEYEGLPVVSL